MSCGKAEHPCIMLSIMLVIVSGQYLFSLLHFVSGKKRIVPGSHKRETFRLEGRRVLVAFVKAFVVFVFFSLLYFLDLTRPEIGT